MKQLFYEENELFAHLSLLGRQGFMDYCKRYDVHCTFNAYMLMCEVYGLSNKPKLTIL